MVLTAWQCVVYKTIQELIHFLTTECYLTSDWHSLTNLEVCDRILCLCCNGLLTCDLFQISNCRIQNLGVLFCFADTHIYYDLLELRYLHYILITKFLGHCINDFVVIHFF